MKRSVIADAALGAAAGAAGTLLMDLATSAMYAREPEAARERENDARGELTAYEIVAERAATRAGRALSSQQRKRIGSAIHWSTGIGAGLLYGILRNRIRAFGLGSGMLFGAAVFVALDEAALTLFGITPPPQEFPWQTHARGLAGHLVLGAVIEAPFNIADFGDGSG